MLIWTVEFFSFQAVISIPNLKFLHQKDYFLATLHAGACVQHVAVLCE